MPNQVTLRELKFLAAQMDLTIYEATYTGRRKVKGTWFKTESCQISIWNKKPSLDNVATYYTLVNIDDDDKEIEKYPAKIRYIHWSDVILFQLTLRDKIDKIKKSAIKIDEVDEAYMILKYL